MWVRVPRLPLTKGLIVQQKDAGPANRPFLISTGRVRFQMGPLFTTSLQNDTVERHRRTTRSRGPAAKTPGLHPGNDGSSPSGIILSSRPGTPMAERLGLNPSVCRFDSCSGHMRKTRLGRQLADHHRLERRMLRVQIPPEPLN